jgi:hypothetical protein
MTKNFGAAIDQVIAVVGFVDLGFWFCGGRSKFTTGISSGGSRDLLVCVFGVFAQRGSTGFGW